MKKLIAATALTLMLAACTQTNQTTPSGSMMQGGMMQDGIMSGNMMKNGQCPMMQDMEAMQKSMKKNCKQMTKDCEGMTGDMAKQCKEMTKTCGSMMKDMKAMCDMHKKMMKNCPMMQGGMMQNQHPADDQSSEAPAGISAADHAKHHPAQ